MIFPVILRVADFLLADFDNLLMIFVTSAVEMDSGITVTAGSI